MHKQTRIKEWTRKNTKKRKIMKIENRQKIDFVMK